MNCLMKSCIPRVPLHTLLTLVEVSTNIAISTTSHLPENGVPENCVEDLKQKKLLTKQESFGMTELQIQNSKG